MSAKILLRQPDVGVGGGGGNETFRGAETDAALRQRTPGGDEGACDWFLPTPGIVLGSHTRLSKEEEAEKQHFTLGWMWALESSLKFKFLLLEELLRREILSEEGVILELRVSGLVC